jgi:hypothetical protein
VKTEDQVDGDAESYGVGSIMVVLEKKKKPNKINVLMFFFLLEFKELIFSL